MDLDGFRGRGSEGDIMGDDPMITGGGDGGYGMSLDKPDEGFDFGGDDPVEPPSDDFDFGSDAPAEPQGGAGGFDFEPAAEEQEMDEGFGREPVNYSEVGETSFFGFFKKGLQMAILRGDAAEDVAADPNAFVPALVIYTLPALVAGVLMALTMSVFSGAMTGQTGAAAQQMQAFLPLVQKFAYFPIILLPLGAIIGSLISVGILHIMAKIFKGEGRFLDYYQTLGVGDLVYWLYYIFMFIFSPLALLVLLWMIPVKVVITSRVHNLSIGRSVAVVLLPLVILFVLGIALFSTIMMTVMGAGGMQGMQGM